MIKMANKVFIWGSKSYALLVDDMLKNASTMLNNKYLNNNKNKFKIEYIFDPYSKKKIYDLRGTYFSKTIEFKKNVKKCKNFIVCIGENFGKARHLTSQFLEKFELRPLTLISKYSVIGNKTTIGKGVVAMPFSYVNAYSKIGDYTILNSNSNIEHECTIGKGSHIMSGACIAGRCKIGDYVTIGSNATILPDIKIEDGSYIGAGSVVTKNVKKNSVIVGVPGKYLKSKKQVVDLKIFNEILQYK